MQASAGQQKTVSPRVKLQDVLRFVHHTFTTFPRPFQGAVPSRQDKVRGNCTKVPRRPDMLLLT